MNPMTKNCERIISKTVLRATDLYGAEEYKNFRADRSIHSFTTAFGLPQQRFAAFCNKKLETNFFIEPPFRGYRFLLKLIAMLEDWQKYTQPVEIKINGKTIFRGELFLENVCKGWPAVYFELPQKILKKENDLEIKNLTPEKNILIVERVEMLKLESFSGSKLKPFPQDCSKGILPMYLGMDNDDHRQDESGEMDRLLRHFVSTRMGNFISFRPGRNRTYPEKYPAKKETWQRWIKFCKKYNIYFQFGGIPPTLTKEEILKYGGGHFLGFQFHEPYLISQPLGMHKLPEEFLKAKNLLEKKNAYVVYLNERASDLKYKNSKILCGDPSLLCVYSRETKVDTILAEPVSNCSLLFGAARGTGKKFGTDIPIDWYFGFPHDEAKSRRFRLLLHLIYAYGGEYAYAQNGLFKTNAFSRNDWEGEFCCRNREMLRRFYKFTLANPRRGKTTVPLAAVYGNLESMFWLPDDCIPELIDTKNWDDFVWGKWKDTLYRWVWKAVEAWLPPLEFENLGKNESLTKMFTGTPYGSVDVVSPYIDLTKYKAVAFLGWNTMDERIYQNLVDYVKNGGILFICGCHLDTRVDLKGKIKIIKNGQVSDLIGTEITGPGEKVFDRFRLCRLKKITAKKIDEFLYENRIGKGKVYFFNFYDYPYDLRLVRIIKNILEKIGEEITTDAEISISGRDTKYINYNLWQDGDTKIVYLINVDWQQEGDKKRVLLKTKTNEQWLEIKEGKTYILKI